jgi:hypothetical protein
LLQEIERGKNRTRSLSTDACREHDDRNNLALSN